VSDAASARVYFAPAPTRPNDRAVDSNRGGNTEDPKGWGTMKKLWILVTALLLFAYAEPALAQGGKLKAQGFYIGGSAGVGLTKLDFDEINLLDDSALVWKAVAGFRWRYFAIEGDYRALSSVSAVFPGSELTAESKGFTGSLLLILPVGPIDIFGRGGGHHATSTVGFGEDLAETKEWVLVYGGGLGFRVGSFALRVEYERLDLEAISELNQVTGGFTVAF